MPRDPNIRERRREAILELLAEGEVIREQKDLVERLGFARVHGLEWWEEREVQGLRVTMTPCRHWGARMFRDTHRGFGGYCVSDGARTVYH